MERWYERLSKLCSAQHRLEVGHAEKGFCYWNNGTMEKIKKKVKVALANVRWDLGKDNFGCGIASASYLWSTLACKNWSCKGGQVRFLLVTKMDLSVENIS